MSINCSECQNPIPSGMIFCANCGHRLTKSLVIKKTLSEFFVPTPDLADGSSAIIKIVRNYLGGLVVIISSVLSISGLLMITEYNGLEWRIIIGEILLFVGYAIFTKGKELRKTIIALSTLGCSIALFTIAVIPLFIDSYQDQTSMSWTGGILMINVVFVVIVMSSKSNSSTGKTKYR